MSYSADPAPGPSPDLARITLARPWLGLDLGRALRVISFAPHRPGLVMARHILWREVRNTDLPPGRDATAWLGQELAARDQGRAVAMLTARDVTRLTWAEACVDGARALCLATVGLGNAEAVGQRRDLAAERGYGTINMALVLQPAPSGLASSGPPPSGLTEAAQLEALTIAAEARTAAVLGAGLRLPGGALASGTGTDCIALAADPGPVAFAGLHTALGEALGQAVLRAIGQGCADWIAENGARPGDPRALGP